VEKEQKDRCGWVYNSKENISGFGDEEELKAYLGELKAYL
jgi:hypothetical protein